MTTTLEHIDGLRDVFAEVTQDCLLQDLTPCMVKVNHNATGTFSASVQFSGVDPRSVDTLAEAWNLPPGRLIGDTARTYMRSGRFDLNGWAVQVDVFTGHPGDPIVSVGYAPLAVQA